MLAVWPVQTVVKPAIPVHLEEVNGLYYESRNDEAGVPFRWTREYASLFVPATAKRAEIPVRAAAGTTKDNPVLIEISSGGMTLTRALIGDAWRVLVVELNTPPPPLAFNRINIRTDRLFQDARRPTAQGGRADRADRLRVMPAPPGGVGRDSPRVAAPPRLAGFDQPPLLEDRQQPSLRIQASTAT